MVDLLVSIHRPSLALAAASLFGLGTGFAGARLDPFDGLSTIHAPAAVLNGDSKALVASLHRDSEEPATALNRDHTAVAQIFALPSGLADTTAAVSTRLNFPTLSPSLPPPSELSDACGAEIAIMSLGSEPSQAIIARFAPASADGCAGCAGPTSIVCTGLLRPGRAWRLLLAPGESVGSAAVFSLSADPLERVFSGGGPAPIAAVVCAALQAAIAESPSEPSSRCDAWVRFEAAWAEGTVYGGVPLEHAVGAALGGQLTSTCTAGIAALQAVGADPASTEHTLPRLDPADSIIVQNAGAGCVSVMLMTRAFSACGSASPCMTFELSPGEARTIASRTCGPFGSGGGASPGSGAIVADGPVAVFLARSDGDGSSMTNAPAVAAGRLAAPIVFDPEQGWSTAVTVQTFADMPGDVAVTVDFLDGEGDTVNRVERRICAGGAYTFERSATTALPGLDTGSVRVRAVHTGARPGPARIAATVRLAHAADAGPGEEPGAGGASAAYALTAIDDAGVGLLAVPSLSKRSETDDGSSAIALANIAAAGNETEYALMLFDPTGLIDTACGTLGAGGVDYIDLDRWTSVPAGFRGSAVISATRWRHAGSEDPLDTAPVRIAAVVARWAGAVAGDDRLALSPALDLPFGSEQATAFASTLPLLPCEPGVPIPGTTATNTPRATQTRTPRPPSTSTPEPVQDYALWLPLTLRAHLVRLPTETPPPTATLEPTPEPSGTAEATLEPSPTPSGTADATPAPSPEPSGTAEATPETSPVPSGTAEATPESSSEPADYAEATSEPSPKLPAPPK